LGQIVFPNPRYCVLNRGAPVGALFSPEVVLSTLLPTRDFSAPQYKLPYN